MDHIKERYLELYQIVLEEHKKVFEAQSLNDIEELMQFIIKANRVFVVGAGREGIAVRSFAMRIMHLGIETYWIWDDTTPGMKDGDLFIVINGSGQIGHIDYLIDQAKATGAKISVITGAPNEHTPKLADLSVFIPAAVYKGKDKRVVKSVQPMGNLFEQHLFLLFDVIVMLLADEMNLSAEQMESRHRNIE